MTRRKFFDAVTSALAWLSLRPPAVAASADPLLPYIKATNEQRWQFLRESEIQWLNEATALVNQVIPAHHAITVEKIVPPYDRKVGTDTYELPDGTRVRIAPTTYLTTEDDDA